MRTIFALLTALLLPALALANGYETYPAPLAWSPDSTLLASVEAESWPYNDGLVTGALRLYHFDGTPLHELLAGASIGSPAFSPDGHLACVHNGKLAVFEGYLEPSSVRFISGPAPALDCTFVQNYVFAKSYDEDPAISLLATFGERFYGADIWQLTLDGSKLQQLTHAGPNDTAFAPFATETVLLFLYQQGSGGDYAYERLWVDEGDSGTQRGSQITQQQERSAWPDDYHESNPSYAADSGEIFFQRGGWGNWKVMRLEEKSNDETGEFEITESIELTDAQQPTVSADGRWLAFVRRPAYAKAQVEYDWEVIPQVFLADRECRQLWRVATGIAGGEFPALSPDGSHLAWLELADGRVQTRIREVAEITAQDFTETY